MSFHIWVAHCGSKAGRCDERREERRKLQLGDFEATFGSSHERAAGSNMSQGIDHDYAS